MMDERRVINNIYAAFISVEQPCPASLMRAILHVVAEEVALQLHEDNPGQAHAKAEV